jgi:hypothetical protein
LRFFSAMPPSVAAALRGHLDEVEVPVAPHGAAP